MIDLNFEEKIFESYIMRFRLPLPELQAQDLVVDRGLEYGGDYFLITDIEDDRAEDGVAMKSVEAEARWMRLADRAKPGTFTITKENPADGLAQILNGTGWTINEVTARTKTFSMDATDKTVLDILWRWARITGCEISFNSFNQSLSFINQIGTTRGDSFTYGYNLKSITRKTKAPAFTRIYPIGKDDLTIADFNGGVPYLEDYSYYTAQGIALEAAKQAYQKDKILSESGVSDAETLYEIAEKDLAANSVKAITYSAKVIDLAAIIPGFPEADYKCGDSVHIEDEPTGISEDARVVRTKKWPHHPDRNEIDLAFTPVIPPDNSSESRPSSNGSWELYISRNEGTIRQIRQGSQILGRIKLSATEDAEWVVGYKLSGIGVGTGTLTVISVDDSELEPIWSEQTIDIVDGEPIEFNFTYGRQDIEAGEYTLVVRANSSGAGVGIDIAEGDTSMWVLARGATRQLLSLDNSIRYDFTGGKQTFTVPDGVTEITVEAVGARGGSSTPSPGGKGGKVIATFPVVSPQEYDVYVGGRSSSNNPYPNGGLGGTANNIGKPGGSSSSMTLAAASFDAGFPSSLIVAAGGGGGADSNFNEGYGGYGGFYAGGDPEGGTCTGATQDAPGIGSNEDGDTDGLGYGGDGEASGATPTAEMGGGGGGWHGGGGSINDHGGGGGGGGSGWLDPSAFDIELFDDSNSDQSGYIIVSWENPVGTD